MDDVNLKAIDLLLAVVENMAAQVADACAKVHGKVRGTLGYVDLIRHGLEGEPDSRTKAIYLQRLERCETILLPLAKLADGE